MSQRYKLFIDNRWEDPASGHWFDTEDPFSGETWAQIPRANTEDVDRAVKSAKAALSGPWGTMSATDRGMLLFRLGQLIEENAGVLAEVEARDNGKLLSEEQDAIRIGNGVRFGLAAGVWTKSLHRAILMSEKLKAGTVWINNYRSTSFTTPFGGFKDSGLGREGGVEAVKEYLEVKSVWISSDLKMPDPFVRKY
jgi:acyl-CoA reductase-like NAD-dependent aldehyde dehydrogenase